MAKALLGFCLLYGGVSLAESKLQIAQTHPTAIGVQKQSVMLVKAKVNEFLTMQTVGYPGEVNIQVGSIDPNLKLPSCENLQIFLPNGSRA